MTISITGGMSFIGKVIVTISSLILNYGLVAEGITEGTEDYLLVSQAVTDTDDFGSIV